MAKSKKGGPQFVRFIGPVVDALNKLGGSGQPAEVKSIIVENLHVSEAELTDSVASGASRFSKNVDWARFYLAKAGYVDASIRGVWSLTDKGRGAVIAPDLAFQVFQEVHAKFGGPKEGNATDGAGPSTPKDLASGAPLSPENIDHRAALMGILQALSPGGFERLCQRLLRESGFESVVVTGKTGDGGLDGIGVLQVNPFVSFKVLFQCKRYAGSVTASQVRDFRGAMMGRTDKGLYLTTGTFTADAKKEAIRDGVPPIELVDGEKLLDMFEQLELGLRPKKAYDIDMGFFAEFAD